MALKRVQILSPNYSSRNNTRVRLIVLHTAEGARTYQSLGSFFSNPSSQVSSHTGIDDTPNTIGEYVYRQNKAWTQANANPYSVSVELCAFANWSPTEWSKHPTMLQNCGEWIREEAFAFGIPLTKLTANQAQSGSSGICQHVDLGSIGGGHWDCGPNFPIDKVMQIAKGESPTEITGDDMIIKEPNGKVYQLIYGGAGSYWRTLPDNAISRIPNSQMISDDGSLLSLWKIGAN